MKKQLTYEYILFDEFNDSIEDAETTQSIIDDFINKWIIPYDVTRVYYWEDDETINYGSVITINGVSELHYISITK